MSPLVISILLSVGVMLVLAVVMGWILGWANVAFHVDVDPKITQIAEALPGANCGACGFAGCNEYASQLVAGTAKVGMCTQCNKESNALISSILGVATAETFPYKAVIHCSADLSQRLNRMPYTGEPTCAAANLVSGIQGCTYGCLGLGDCTRACTHDAIHVVNGLATVDYTKCVGCRQCENVCPRNIISIIPFKRSQVLVVACSNKDFGPDVKSVCKTGCIGCSACSRNASEGISMQGFLPMVDYMLFQSASAFTVAQEKCPAKSLVFVGVPTDEEQEAVKDEALPEVVTDDFKSTVDETSWRN